MYLKKSFQRIGMLVTLSLFFVACSGEPVSNSPTEDLTGRVNSAVPSQNEESSWLTDTIHALGYETNPVLEVDGGDLSGERENNVAVNVGFGDREYWAFTNDYGQLVAVVAEYVVLQNEETEDVLESGRYYHDEAKVPGTEAKDLDEGHVIADSLGGVSNAYNITPQDSVLNRHGDQAYMEEVIRKAGGCKYFIATISYPNNQTQIPSSYSYEYTVNGNAVVDTFPNKDPEEKKEDGDASEEMLGDETALVNAIDTNNNGIITIKEAEAAGYSMPITSEHWLYSYMRDSNQDGIIGQ